MIRILHDAEIWKASLLDCHAGLSRGCGNAGCGKHVRLRIAGIGVAVVGALVIGLFAENRLSALIAGLVRIAQGDRFASLPSAIGDGALQKFDEAAEAMRRALGQADNVVIDRDRRAT